VARPAVFLDRDGVLNDLVCRDGAAVSPREPDEFRLRAEAASAVRDLRSAGFPVLVVSNQPDIARGRMGPAALECMTAMLRSAVPVDDVAVCPHDDADACGCRKPKPGLLLALASRWDVDLARSYMIGDSWRDIGAGRAAGCRTILIGADVGTPIEPDAALPDLRSAVAAILRSTNRSTPGPEP
jgi:D-glycero-D-manno-heptose 1,7-bisphosphate phosphatase